MVDQQNSMVVFLLALFRSVYLSRPNVLRAVAGLSLGLVLTACNPNFDFDERHTKPLSNATKTRLENLKMDAKSPMVVRIYKEEAELEVWKWRKIDRKYALYKKYDICAYSGELGPKIKEGDRQAPEGFYTIVPGLMNPKSNYYLAFNLGYPNAFDRAHNRTGSHLMVHGSCSSRGCYAMEDDQIEEIYQLGRESFSAGQRSFQVQAFPFRMTDANMARHSNSPHADFWRMLKEGADHFEATKQPPKVDVCGKRYVFNAVAADGETFVPDEACPPYSVPEPIARAVAKHRGETYVPQTPIMATPIAQSAMVTPAVPAAEAPPAFTVAETAEPAPFEAEAEPKGLFTKLFRR
jgi:murein L,D-transpeptidase YafK